MKKILGLLILLFFLITACSNKDTIDGENGQSKEDTIEPTATLLSATIADGENQLEDPIIIQFAVDDFSVSSYDTLIAAFAQEQPHIIIQVKAISEITVGLEPEEAMVRLAQTADVFDSRTLFTANWQQLALDLTPFIVATPTFNRDDFPANLLQEPDSSIRVLPVSLNPVLLAYNKMLFAEADLEAPQPSWTWDEFRAAAIALTIEDNGETEQWGLVHAFPGSLAFYTAYVDGWLVNWNETLPRPRFDEPALINAVQQHTNLYLVDEVGPDGSTVEAYNEAEQLIAEGQVAMWPIFYTELSRYADMQEIGIVPFPIAQHPETTLVYVNGFAISAGTAQAQAAWEWINFLSQQMPVTEGIPARTTTREASQFWQGVDTEVQEVVEYGLAHSFKYYFHPVNNIFVNAVTDILTNYRPVEEVLAEAQNAAIPMMAGGEGTEITMIEVNEDEPSTDEAITITFIPSLTNDTEPYRLAARQFERDHPEIRVDVRVASLDFIPNLDRGSEIGDCFQWFATLPYDQVGRENIISLDAFVQADNTFDLDAFYPSLVDALVVQGELWGLPSDVTPLIIEYNKDLFDAAGVPYPQPGWTMTEFLDTAVALTNGEGDTKQFGFVPEVSENLTITPMLNRLGANLLDYTTNPPTFSFTDPATVEAVRWYTDLSQTYDVKPVLLLDPVQSFQVTSVGAYFDERRRLIQGGLAGMWSRWSNDNYGLQQADTEGLTSLGAVPLPLNPGGQSLTDSQMSYFIAADTPHRQACWQWLTFITTVDASEGMPARISLAESAAYRRRVGTEIAQAQVATIVQMEQPGPPAIQAQWLAYGSIWLFRAIAQIVEEDISVEVALADAQELFDAYRNCVIENDAFQDSQIQDRCAKEIDSAIPDEFFFGG